MYSSILSLFCVVVSGVGQGSKKASVHLLSAEDGCQAMVQVAWDLSRRVAAKQLVADDISPSIVTQSLHGRLREMCSLFWFERGRER